ncbi:MAG TPA: RHS repeat-associated core domain-containing protein [Vicinamibacterales bacterium]|nr:RHS repeat-associated core domain-containing protein [Vicinamibacterales bacterium]
MNLSSVSTRIRSGVCIAIVGAALLALIPRAPVGAQSVPADLAGYSVTLLPDGRELILGGVSGGIVQRGGWIRDPRSAAVAPVEGLTAPRAWHSATLLPDGTVLVLGGSDNRGIVSQAERLIVGQAAPAVGEAKWNARAGHTATLIDGNRILLVGGLASGVPVASIEVLAIDTLTAAPLGNLPGGGRAFHTARLLGDGTTEIWAGEDANRSPLASGVVINSDTGAMVQIAAPERDENFATLAFSNPEQGASNVPLQPQVALRLTRPAQVETVTNRTITFSSPAGEVPVAVVAAERGRLVFVTPTVPLQPNTGYTITAEGLRDSTGTAFPFLTVSFTTVSETLDSPDPEEELWEPFETSGVPTWRSNRAASKWQELPPLMAAPGVTAMSGQVLKLNGTPLAGVTLKIQGQSVTTDRTGRFLLANERMTTGWRELSMDGRTANGRGATYGTFEAAVHVTAGRTTVLPYTIWMPRIDTANAVKIASPTTAETVITTPKIPGLELRLPPGTVISDEDGRIVREVSITPIPIDRTPFPLPEGVNVPIYFTIQPGGAYVAVTGTGERRGARLVYPNYHGYQAGMTIDFWHYNPRDGKGWYVYGQGTVTADRRQVAPNPGVSLYEFTGAMIAPPSLNPPPGPPPADPGKDGDPVHLGTGQFTLEVSDLILSDVLPIGIQRTYRANDTIARSFGRGASHQYDMFLSGNTSPYNYVDLILPDGGRVHYDRISPGTGFSDAVYEHTGSPSEYFKSKIYWNGTGWNLDLKDGTRITFLEGFGASRSSQAAIARIQDRYGSTVVLTRDSNADLTRVSSANGKWIELTYDASHRVTQAKDQTNRIVQYTYDTSGRLWKVTDPLNGVTEYTYDTSHRMLTIKDARSNVYLTNEYSTAGRVTKQTQTDSTTYLFAYTLDGAGKVTQTDVTNPRGFVRRATYNSAGYLLTDTYALGETQQQTFTYERQTGTNLVTAVVDPLNRRTEHTYDSFGNITSTTRLAGTANAVIETATYEPAFKQLASRTDPLNHTVTFGYDASGNVTSITDPLSQQTTLTYNSNGQPLTITTPAGTTTLTYDGGDVATIADPLGRTTTRFVDSLGRLVRLTNPLGQAMTYEYDALNRLTKSTDALGGQTTFTYDANNNLLTLTDARNQTTTYTYDNMDRVATRTDPLTRTESYVYNANGNPQQATDRKTQVTTYTYDPLERLTTTTYADSSTTTTTYDAGNRATQIADSVAGTISRTYDQLDRLTQETTPEGTVDYTYDAAGRRSSMTVAGQTQVSYSYDNADRLIGITQGTSTVGFTYDSAGRRSTLTLPNGVTVTYGHDAASQVTAIDYTLGMTTLGNLTYTYNVAGRRTAIEGSWARTGLPSTLASATYDAANQIATWGGTSFTYDANGNLTSDGTKTYTWNARNQLIGLGGGGSASFSYDGLGRRRTKTVSSITTAFLYDGLNTVQELIGGSPSANILPGLGIDEWLGRTVSAGARYFLTDALGSALALSDASGTVQTQYSFEPFGKTSVSGTSDANTMQFAGRENDATGLFFNRARYYDPTLQRFISEDPIEFAGGTENLHSYVSNDPLGFRDPSGLILMKAPPGCQPGKSEDLPLLQKILCVQIPILPLPMILPRLPIPPGLIPPVLPRGVPRSPKNFKPPTNPPQMPPKDIPKDDVIRRMPPTDDYKDGYWRWYRPFPDGTVHPINPRTGRQGPPEDTHIPFPPGMGPK